jgi:hypothetical protein
MDLGWSDLFRTIVEILAAVIIAVLAFLLRKGKKFVANHMVTLTQKHLNRNLRIKEILQEARAIFDVERIRLYQFHNGDHFVSGESSQKASLTHYVLARGFQPVSQAAIHHHNIPVSFIIELAGRMAGGTILSEQTKALDDELYFKPLAIQEGTKHLIIAPVLGRRGQLLAFLYVAWMRDPEQNLLNFDKLKEICVRVSAELQFKEG